MSPRWPLLALLLGACRTVETRALERPPLAEVRVGTRARSWDVYQAGECIGRVVLFQDQGAIRDSVYVVKNPWHQDLGLIDGLGRAYRYLPHHKEPAWVGSGTIALGVERILGRAEPCLLVETELVPQGDTELPVLASEPVPEPSEHAPAPASSPAAPDGGLPQSPPAPRSKDLKPPPGPHPFLSP